MMTKVKSIIAALTIGAGMTLTFILWALAGAWSQQDHDDLDQKSALTHAERELIRTSRRIDNNSTAEGVLGDSCLVSSKQTDKFKMFVFEFKNQQKSILRTIYVASSPEDLVVEVTSNAEPRPDGTPSWSDPVKNCGKLQP